MFLTYQACIHNDFLKLFFMNYGSIAYLNEGKLFIPEYLLRPLNIDNNTHLTLLSYTTPKPEEEEEYLKKLGYDNLPIKHDIIITPIPFRLWPFLVRARVLLMERKGSIAAISKYFASKKLNILSADCHRAGFRYMVYSCILECSDIRKKYYKQLRTSDSSKLDEKEWNKLLKEVKEKIEVIRKDLEPYTTEEFEENKTLLSPFNVKVKKKELVREMRRFLFPPTENEKANGMVSEIYQSSTLPFHYIKKLQGGAQSKRMTHYSKYVDGAIKLPESYHAEIRNNYGIDFSDKRNTPTFGFVNVDTNAPRIRVTLTPKFQINDFRRVIIDYRRDSSEKNGSVGFMAAISKRLTSKFNLNLENVVNRIWLYKKKTELGKVEFIVEKSCEQDIDWEQVAEDIKRTILKNNNKFHNSETIVKCIPISPYKFFVSLKTSDEKFVQNTKKLLYKAGRNLGIGEADFVFVWTHSTPVTESVVSALRESNALVQIYHSTDVKTEQDFSWLDGEFLAMRALDKPCARICSDNSFFNNGFSKFDKDVAPYVINFAHGDRVVTRKYTELLQGLINRIELNEPNVLNRFR